MQRFATAYYTSSEQLAHGTYLIELLKHRGERAAWRAPWALQLDEIDMS